LLHGAIFPERGENRLLFGVIFPEREENMLLFGVIFPERGENMLLHGAIFPERGENMLLIEFFWEYSEKCVILFGEDHKLFFLLTPDFCLLFSTPSFKPYELPTLDS
jgi:hypothetical protein